MHKHVTFLWGVFCWILLTSIPTALVANDLTENPTTPPPHNLLPNRSASSISDTDNGDGTWTFAMLVDENSTPPNYNGPWTDNSYQCSWNYGFEIYSWYNQDYGWVHTFSHWNDPNLNIISAKLTIIAWDVDSEPFNGWDGEYDGVHVDGSLLSPGYLQGYNGEWSTTVFDIPLSSITDDGIINVWLDIDMHHSECWWATTLDFSYLEIVYSTFENDPPYQPEVSWGYLGNVDCVTGEECVTYGEGLLVEVVGPIPTDPDSDAVSYEYRWFVDIGTGGFIDDEFAGRGNHTGNSVPPSDIQPSDVWQVQIIPVDEHGAIGEQTTVTFPPFCTIDCPFGCIAGNVTADCPVPGTGLYGVMVDVFEVGTGVLVANVATDLYGRYEVCDLPVADYGVSVVTPLGYSITADELTITVIGNDTVAADFALFCQTVPSLPRTIGYWKHQIGVATGGNGKAQVDAATLCTYLDLIEGHFNGNAINQVVIYESPGPGATCEEKLAVAKVLLNLTGSETMLARAQQQLMALLLNVAAGYLHQMASISKDGATVSQAITHCDLLIDDGDPGNDETAKTIADLINNSLMVPAGMIPLSTANISYRVQYPDRLAVSQNYPNPFNPRTTIQLNLPVAGEYAMVIYNVVGQRIRTFSGYAEAGEMSISWDGTDETGNTVSSGIYFYRVTVGSLVETRKMVLMK